MEFGPLCSSARARGALVSEGWSRRRRRAPTGAAKEETIRRVRVLTLYPALRARHDRSRSGLFDLICGPRMVGAGQPVLGAVRIYGRAGALSRDRTSQTVCLARLETLAGYDRSPDEFRK